MTMKRYPVEFTLAELYAAQLACAAYDFRQSAAQRRANERLCEAIALARHKQSPKDSRK